MKLTEFSLLRPVTLAGMLACALSIGGCGGLVRESPVKQTYLLAPMQPAAAVTPRAGALRLGTIAVAAPYRGRSFVYRDSEFKFTSDYYEEFIVPPGPMITEATGRALAAARLFTSTSGQNIATDAAWTLDGFVGAFYGDLREKNRAAAVFEVTFYLTRAGDGSPAWSRAYARRVEASAMTPAAYVAAQNLALGEILAELVRDIAAADLPRG